MPEALAPQGETFAERKTAQLTQERLQAGGPVVEPAAPADPPPGAPEGQAELAAEVVEQDPQGLYVSEEDEPADLEDSPEALTEAPEGEDLAPELDPTDWEKRYKDLQSMTQADVESRGEMEMEHAESMSQHLQLRFEMEDRLNEAVQRAEYMKNVMSGNAQQFKNINWSQVPPDKYQEVQAQAQQAMQLEQQTEAGYAQMQAYVEEQRDVQKKREAAIAKVRLKRTIPNWNNDTYVELREFAAKTGMPAEEFNRITNPILIEALHAYRTIREGATTVQKVVENRKAKTPRGKAARRLPRDARGKFAQAVVVPNQRGSFANKAQHRLAMERQGR